MAGRDVNPTPNQMIFTPDQIQNFTKNFLEKCKITTTCSSSSLLLLDDDPELDSGELKKNDIIEIKGVQKWIRKHCASSLIFGSGLFDWLAAALEGQKGLGVIGRSRQTNAQVN